MAGGSGGMGRFRLGAKRISWPDWVRAAAVKSDGEAVGSVSDTDIIADAKITVGNATGTVPNSISIAIAQGINGDVNGKSPPPQINTISVVGFGNVEADSKIPVIRTVNETNNGIGESNSPNPVTETVHNAKIGKVETDSQLPTISSLHDAEISVGKGSSSVPTITSIVDAEAANEDTDGSIGIVTWKAGLGGVVKDPYGNAVEGAEVHIIRDNDDVKVDSLETDVNGRWHSTLPGGKTTDPDPEVYSIEVWYRNGDKRDPNATLYNSKNRPFIDTSDPSQTSPYK